MQKSASIQPRTSPTKFAGKISIQYSLHSLVDPEAIWRRALLPGEPNACSVLRGLVPAWRLDLGLVQRENLVHVPHEACDPLVEAREKLGVGLGKRRAPAVHDEVHDEPRLAAELLDLVRQHGVDGERVEGVGHRGVGHRSWVPNDLDCLSKKMRLEKEGGHFQNT